MPKQAKPLEPLIPVEEFRKVVAALARVPKDAIVPVKPRAKQATRKTIERPRSPTRED